MTTVNILHEVEASDRPSFVIKADGARGPVYYVTLAVWEYDLNNAQTDEERAGCHNVAAFYEVQRLTETRGAAQLPPDRDIMTLGIGTKFVTPKPLPPPSPPPVAD